MEIINRNPKELIKADYNPRKISDKDFKQLKKSLETFQCVEPIVVNQFEGRENVIVGGHQRLKAMESLGWSEVPTIEVYLDLEEEKELNVRLNKNTGEFDFELLTDLFDTDKLEEIGFELDELPDITEDLTEPLTDPDEAPEPPKEPKTKLGDIYELGNHRLMCGDSTSIDAVEKLMNGEKADMVFTDPPYNIGYQDMNGEFDKIKNDKMSDEDFLQFLCDSIYWDSDTMYVCCSWQYSHLFKQAMEMNGKKPKAMIVWNKVNPAQNLDKYYKAHEIIYYFGEFGGSKTLRSDVWELKRERNTLHPTMKPIGLIDMALEDQPTKKIVYDGFGGSGSTLIACEGKKKKARLMELDPKYCDVIVERWENFTGKKAKLLENVGQ